MIVSRWVFVSVLLFVRELGCVSGPGACYTSLSACDADERRAETRLGQSGLLTDSWKLRVYSGSSLFYHISFLTRHDNLEWGLISE